MIITFFHNSTDNIPAQSEISWDELAKGLSDVRQAQCTLASCKRSECPHKDGPAWSTARYQPDSRRAVSNVIDVQALIIDLDHVSPEELPELLEKVDSYKRIVTSSHSDRELDRCLRIVIALTRPVDAKDWYRFWGEAIKQLGLPADKQVKDPSRLYYLPSRPSDACEVSWDGNGFAFESSDGECLDVDAILAAAPEYASVMEADFELPEFTGAPSQDALVTAVQILAGGWPEKGRNTCQLALCGALARAGWPVELIADFVEAVSETAHPGNGDRPKRLKAARASVAKIQNGEFIAGWPTVEEYVDPQLVKDAMEALGMGGPKFDQSFVNEMKKHVNAYSHDVSLGLGKVTVSRDDVQCTLEAARKRLARTTNPKKIKESKLIGRALDGKPFTEHPDEDADQAFAGALKAIVRHAPRGSSNIVLAEYLAASRPDIPVDTLCDMIEQARALNSNDDKAELPPDEFVLEITGPRVGKPLASSQHNFEIGFRRLGISFHYDEFSRKKIVERKMEDALYREVVEDSHVNEIMFEFEQKFDFFPPKDKFYAYCDYRARQSSFHPVRDYLDGLEAWDGVSRSETWLIDCGAAEDTPYVRAVSRLVLVAAVRRVRQPGCKFDEMLILESPQGSYKSTAIKALCPNQEWFADNFHLDGDTKKMIEQTAGKWIVEAGELKGMSNRDANALKAYLSSTADEARMSYARETQRLPRQFIIIGTTNDTQYLKDHTGDRRYWPVRVGVFNVEKLLAMRDQLWAEASYLEAENPDASFIRLDPSLYGAAAVEQSNRKMDNPVKVRLEEFLGDKTGRIKTSDTWKLLTDDPVVSTQLTNQASNAMQELGWKKTRLQMQGTRASYYLKGTPEEQQKLLIVTGNMSFGLTVKSVDADANGDPIIDPVLSKTKHN